MKKVLLCFLILQFFIMAGANEIDKYSTKPYVGTEINDAMRDSIPFVLVIADPDDKISIMKYIPIGKMVYTKFYKKYNFCILNYNSNENEEYLNFFKPTNLPAVYVVTPKEMVYAKIQKKYHNSRDMKRILTNML